jgi:sulfopyruvate decarboxylase TPP-binding subunit
MPELPNEADDTLRGSSVIAALKEAGVGTVITVPDITTSEGLLRPIASDPELRHILVCKEDEGVGIGAGLSFCDERAVLLIQNTGLLDSINAIRAVGVEYQLPICMMVGLLGKPPGLAPTDSENWGVRIVEPILDAMNIEHHLLETEDDLGAIRPAIDQAYDRSRPVVLLIGRSPLAQ